jgi:hypothetical protein
MEEEGRRSEKRREDGGEGEGGNAFVKEGFTVGRDRQRERLREGVCALEAGGGGGAPLRVRRVLPVRRGRRGQW